MGLKCTQQVAISTHTPLAGRDKSRIYSTLDLRISTHTPLAGRDNTAAGSAWIMLKISTHTPLAGRDICAFASLS